MPERVRFTLDGRPAEADGGTSLLAALWNAGRRAVRTSVSGEARGPVCGMGVCFECRVTIDGEPHRRACLETVREGMEVRPGGLCHSEGLRLDGPRGIRSLSAGPGRRRPPRWSSWAADRQESRRPSTPRRPARARCSSTSRRGPAARSGGARRPRPPASGSTAWRARERRCSRAPRWWTRRGRTSCSSSATALPVRVGYERLVLATGARELFLPFPGWTLPGVVGVGGAQALLKAGARFEGLRVVVAGSGPLLLAVAAALKQAGARIVGIAEQAPLSRLAAFGAGLWRQPHRIAEGLGYAATLRGVALPDGHVGPRGARRRGRPSGGPGRHAGGRAVGVRRPGLRLRPRAEPGAAAPPRLRDDGRGVVVDASQRTSRDGVFAAGELCGIAGVDHALATGAIAGLAAAGRGTPPALAARRARETGFAGRLARAFALRDELLVARSPRHDRLPLRGRPARPPRRGRLGARGEAAHARRHGRLSGSRVRRGARLPPRLHARHACARRSRRSPSRSWRRRTTGPLLPLRQERLPVPRLETLQVVESGNEAGVVGPREAAQR